MSQLNVKNLSNENEDGAPEIANISDFSATSYMCPPKGTTAQRPTSPNPGDIRFNTDTASLEYYKGDTLNWTQIEMTSPDLDGGVRAVAFGGNNGDSYTDIEYFTISTLGNALDFGNLASKRTAAASCASRTRGFCASGQESPTVSADIDYITFSSTNTLLDNGDINLQSQIDVRCVLISFIIFEYQIL